MSIVIELVCGVGWPVTRWSRQTERWSWSPTIFLIALGIFTLGSALCAFAPNPQALIAFRVLQGIGGGALLPVAMAMISRLFGPTERAGAMSLLMIPLLLGPAFGPVLGGYLAPSWPSSLAAIPHSQLPKQLNSAARRLRSRPLFR